MARRYSLDGRLGRVLVRGGRLREDVADLVTGASLSLSASEVTQLDLSLTLADASLDALASGLFNPGTPRRRGARVTYGRLNLEVRAVEVGPRGADHVLRVTARSLGAGNLKRARGRLVRRDLSPTQFAELEAREAGLRFVGQRTASRRTIARLAGKDAETSWDTLQRLAEEVGFLGFEAAGVYYFGEPSWLIDRGDPFEVTWRGRRTADTLDALPVCRRTGDDPRRAATVEAQVRGDVADRVLPGMALALTGVPTFDGSYLVTGVTLPLAEDAAATVTATTPIDPTPQPPTGNGPGNTAARSATGDPAGTRSAAMFTAVALKQAGDQYVYGVEVAAGDEDPNAFDCSELIEWAAARVGVRFVDGSAAQIDACKPITVAEGIRTRGALLYHPGHIAISLGDGRTIEAANARAGVVSYDAAGRFTRAGLIPGLNY